MSNDDYLVGIIRKYVPSSDALQVAANVIPYIRQWASQSGFPLLGVDYSGSHAKGTAVSLSADVDLFVSIDSICTTPLKEIYLSLARFFQRLAPTRNQNVSVRLVLDSVKIDIVPARKQPGNTNDHSLYRSKADTWTKTNVNQHIAIVRQARRSSEIKLTKIWRCLHSIDLPSILLEILVIESLKGYGSSKVEHNFLAIFAYLRDNIERIRVLDPANTNNVLSDELTAHEKTKISRIANEAIRAPYWSGVVW